LSYACSNVTGVDDALALVSEAVDELAGRTVLPAGDETLARRLVTAHRAAQQLLGVVLALVHQIDTAGLAGRAGAPSTTAWLRQRLHVTAVGARRLTVLAAAVEGAPPAVRHALASGLVGLDQIQAITAALSRLPADAGPTVDKAAQALVDHARELPADDLSRLGQRILWHVAPDVAERADHEALRREEASADRDRFFTITPDGPAAVRVHGRFDREAAAIIRAALDPLCNPRTAPLARPSVIGPSCATHRGRPPTAPAETRHAARAHDDPPPAASPDGALRTAGATQYAHDRPAPAASSGADGRTAGQRRADALVEVCRLALNTGELPDNGGDRPQVVVTVPFDPLRQALGVGTFDHGDRISAGAARRLCCDARILPAVLDGNGQPLDLGRERRLITGALRRALVLRDGGCAFPDCDRPPRWCDGHHVRHWADGGHTSLANAVLLCGYHHRLVHDPAAGWTVHIARDGRPTFTPPAWVDPDRTPRRNLYHRRP
jgi:hypothetical protein